MPALLERETRKAEGTWARIEFTHKSTASSAFVSSSKFILPVLSLPTSKHGEQHRGAGKTFTSISETTKEEGGRMPSSVCLLKDRNHKPWCWLQTAPRPQTKEKSSAVDHSLPRSKDLRRENYSDSVLCAKVQQKYADTFPHTKRD